MKINIASVLIVVTIAFFGLSLQTRAVVPPPDGGYPGFNTAEGTNALLSLTTGAANTAVGWYSLFSNAEGSFNTATGAGALLFNTANGNTAFGAAALLFNTSGTDNTAVGTAALSNNSESDGNTAIGSNALLNNAAAVNTACGAGALYSNIDGNQNTATGYRALYLNTSGSNNTAVGNEALLQHHTGNYNNAFGTYALELNTSGDGNNAFGESALLSVGTGSNNTAVGDSAGENLVDGSGNVYIGQGMGGLSTESNHTYLRNIKETTVSGGGTDTVTVNLTTGLLGHLSSSQRYKEDIKPMENSSKALYRLKPVAFRYKKEIDRTQSPVFGLIAEQVAEVNPALVAHNSQGQPESVHYEQVNAMLLNEFLKEHRKVEKLEATVADLAAQLQKVSAQVQMNNSAAQVIVSNH